MKLIPFKTSSNDLVSFNPMAVKTVILRVPAPEDGLDDAAVVVNLCDYVTLFSPDLTDADAKVLYDDVVKRVNEELSAHAPGRP